MEEGREREREGGREGRRERDRDFVTDSEECILQYNFHR